MDSGDETLLMVFIWVSKKCLSGHAKLLEIFKYLIEKGADPTLISVTRDGFKKSPLQVIVESHEDSSVPQIIEIIESFEVFWNILKITLNMITQSMKRF